MCVRVIGDLCVGVAEDLCVGVIEDLCVGVVEDLCVQVMEDLFYTLTLTCSRVPVLCVSSFDTDLADSQLEFCPPAAPGNDGLDSGPDVPPQGRTLPAQF